MDKLLAFVVLLIGALALLVGLSALMALPVEWLWNGTLVDLFPKLPQLDFWHAWGLNLLTGFLFKSTNTSSSSKKD
jgi:hypothetical protein